MIATIHARNLCFAVGRDQADEWPRHDVVSTEPDGVAPLTWELPIWLVRGGTRTERKAMTDSDRNDKGLDEALAQIAVETARDARGFLGKVFGPAATEFGATLGEQMRFWRFKNLNRILAEAQKITQARGHKTSALQELPFGDALRTVEAASYEEEETVQKLWARLIANAVDPKSQVTVKKVYIDILRSISPAEAVFLELIWTCEKKVLFRTVDEVAAFNREMSALAEAHWRKCAYEDQRAAIQNLARIRCVAYRPRPVNMTRLFAELPRETRRGFEKWSVVDPEKFQKVMSEIGDLVLIAAGIKEYRTTGPISLTGSVLGPGGIGAKIEVPEMNFMLTALGNNLMQACAADEAGNGDEGSNL